MEVFFPPQKRPDGSEVRDPTIVQVAVRLDSHSSCVVHYSMLTGKFTSHSTAYPPAKNLLCMRSYKTKLMCGTETLPDPHLEAYNLLGSSRNRLIENAVAPMQHSSLIIEGDMYLLTGGTRLFFLGVHHNCKRTNSQKEPVGGRTA
jgi:hypothetical protein